MAMKERRVKFQEAMWCTFAVLFINFLLLDLSSCDLNCKKGPVTVTGKIAATAEMLSLFGRCADDYKEFRRKHGIDVDVDVHRIARGAADNVDRLYLFSIPSIFNWAGENEFTFPLLSRALVIVFNVPGIKTLQMPVDLIADIYKGNITMWDDQKIKRYNPNVTLPAERILIVARQEEMEVSTTLFTFMLTRMDNEWAEKYGIFRGPNFVNGTCCQSRNWRNVVKYYAADTVGVVGLVLSIPYTIGYGGRPQVESYNLTTVTLLQDSESSEIVDPSIEALQVPLTAYAASSNPDFVSNNRSIAIMKTNYLASGSYPMTAISYITVNNHYSSRLGDDCCAVREMVGYLQSMMLPADPAVFTNARFAPLPRSMAELILSVVLKRVTCDGVNMYDAYYQSYTQSFGGFSEAAIIMTILSLILLTSGIAGAAFLYDRTRKRRAAANSFRISANRLKVDTVITNGTPTPLARPRTDDMRSFADSRKAAAMTKEQTFLKDIFLHGDLDENVKVSLVEFPLPACSKDGQQTKVYTIEQWSEKTKSLANRLRKNTSSHRNLAPFLGLVELTDEKTYTVFEYSAKGTLHYNLATCRYRLTDSIRRYLAVDVASGLEYLHTRVGAVHGQLNSLTCVLDLAWTVKIVLWDQAALHHSESLRGGPGDKAFFSGDNRWRCKPEEVKQILQGENGPTALIRLVYLDPQLPYVYPQSAVDIYSFGMLLCEIFTGKMPYEEELMICQSGTANGVITPDVTNTHLDAYACMLAKKFEEPTNVRLPSLNKFPKYAQNITEACLRADAEKRPTMKSILRHLSVSANDVNKGGLVDAMMETMDMYAENLEEKVEERTAELKQVTARMRDLLNEVLPPEIAEKLFQGVAVPPEYFECVTVYFSDIVGFTIISARSTPIQVMNFLNDLWLTFDAIIQDFDVYKVDTIGDAYMVCSGLPNRNGVQHCRQVAQMALALLGACKKFKVSHLPDEKLHIRIGLNSGPVTAGVVGLKMPQYCVFGDTVNTAARMESTSLPGRIQISSSTYMMLVDHFPGEFAYEYRGEINVKGKGNMLTYWLLSSDDFARRSKTSAISNAV